MERLVNENGQIIFDGVHTEQELIEMAFDQLERFYYIVESLKATNPSIANQIERYVEK